MLSISSGVRFCCRYTSNMTLYITHNHLPLGIHSYRFRTSNIQYLTLSPADHSISDREDLFRHLMLVQNVDLLLMERFPLNQQVSLSDLCLRLLSLQAASYCSSSGNDQIERVLIILSVRNITCGVFNHHLRRLPSAVNPSRWVYICSLLGMWELRNRTSLKEM